MELRRYYQLSLSLPLVVPACCELFSQPRAPARTILLSSMLFGGIPYVVFAIGVLWRLRRQPASAYRNFSTVAPLVYSFVLFAYCLLLGGPGAAVIFLPWALGLGYSYVALAHALRLLLQHLGFVGSSSP
jgi:hypothetical protein